MRCIAVSLGVLALAGAVRSQQTGGFRLQRFDAGLRLTGEARDEERVNTFNSISERELSIREDLLLHLVGDYYHPRFLEYDLKAEVGLEQSDLSGTGPRSNRDLDNTNLSYNLQTRWFKEHPYSARIYSWATETRTRQTFFETTEALLMESGGDVNAKDWWIPSRLHYHHFTYDGRGADTNEEVRDNLKLDGQRSVGSTRLRYDLEYNKVDLQSFDTRFEDYNAQASGSHNFGERDQNIVAAGFRYREQVGDIDSRILSAGGSSRLQLRDDLAWDNDLQFDRNVASGTARSDTWRADSRLTHQLYESLQTTGSGNYLATDFGTGDLVRYGGALDLAYRKRVPFGSISLGFGWNGFIQDEDNPDTRISILDEVHLFVLGVPIFLDNTGVDTATIVVTDTTGLILYQLGRDYLVSFDSGRTRLDIPVSSFIVPGQTILVDYDFFPRPDIRFRSLGNSVSFGMRVFDVASIDLGYSASDQKVLSGIDTGTLDDQRLRTARAFASRWGQSVNASYSNQDSSFTPFERWEVGAGSSIPITSELTGRLGASTFRTRFKDGGGRERGTTLSANLDWILGPATALHARSEWRDVSIRSDQGTGFLAELSLATDWRDASIAFELRYATEDFEIASDTKLFYARLTFTRRF